MAATHELLARGWSAYRLRSAVAAASIVRVRQGWYANAVADDVLVKAVRVGGRATCVTAAVQLGLWTVSDGRLHVSARPHTSRLRTPIDKRKRLSTNPDATAVVHWSASSGSSRFLTSILDILRDMAMCQSPEVTVATADCAIRGGLLTHDEWLGALSSLPPKLRRLLARVDARAESMLESLMRFRLSMMGIETRLQVYVPKAGRVDLLIGSRLVIELDGWEFHKSREAFEEDRRRDAQLVSMGYCVLRFTYRQLRRSWHVVRAAVLACIARGAHG